MSDTQVIILSVTALLEAAVSVGYFFGRRNGINIGFNEAWMKRDAMDKARRDARGRYRSIKEKRPLAP